MTLRQAPIVTVDGPAGSGKSTTAREVARRLGFRHLDSGALYRAVTYALLETGREPDRWDDMGPEDLAGLGLTVVPAEEGLEIRLAGRALGPELRTSRVTSLVSRLARIGAVREVLLGLQREAGARGGLVADGRDMGTVVFPSAEVKVFLVADLGERARRRLRERGMGSPEEEELSREAESLGGRDREDSDRALSPLRPAVDAVEIDTTGLSFEDQVQAVVDLVTTRTGARPAG